MRIADSILMEIDQEAATTRRLLERVPEGKLSWRPHPKSMTLGQLAWHVAQTQGRVVDAVSVDTMEVPDFGIQPSAETKTQLLSEFDAGLAHAKEVINRWDDATANSSWTLTREGQVLMSLTRLGFMRAVGMNHLYHHRGQLSVYLRLLDVPLPSIYGPSADENPFG
ncbi:MAG: DinB family protein [Acidobacteria bacterium]|nr:DinB family protein [Acidobacteriota bacterium]